MPGVRCDSTLDEAFDVLESRVASLLGGLSRSGTHGTCKCACSLLRRRHWKSSALMVNFFFLSDRCTPSGVSSPWDASF